jgi:Uncharacterized homolog of gamma-carboxymuconolactone decarboxylase subunit
MTDKSSEDQDRLGAGMSVRRSVLGDAHVDRAIASTTPLTAEFQSLITRYAWGEIWSRPGLDVRTRRILVSARSWHFTTGRSSRCTSAPHSPRAIWLPKT